MSADAADQSGRSIDHSHTGPPIPASFDGVTTGWLTEALASSGRAPLPIGDLQLEPLGAGASFLGDLARLTITYDTTGTPPDPAALSPQRLLLKLPPADPGGQLLSELLGTWWREPRFYDELASDVGVGVARCYFSAVDANTKRFALLLEDLYPAATGNQVAGATERQTDLTVDALARLHARWWVVPRPTFPPWVPGIDHGVGPLLGAIGAAQPAFRARWSATVAPETIDWLDRGLGRLGELLVDLADGPLTLAHADVHLTNLLFDADETVWFIDWQTAMRTHGVTDLTFFLNTCLTTDDRRARERELLERYRAGLASAGVTVAPAELERLHRISTFWWMAMLSNNLATIEPTDEHGQALFTAIISRSFTAGTDLDIGGLL